jgi:hypothetical protein
MSFSYISQVPRSWTHIRSLPETGHIRRTVPRPCQHPRKLLTPSFSIDELSETLSERGPQRSSATYYPNAYPSSHELHVRSVLSHGSCQMHIHRDINWFQFSKISAIKKNKYMTVNKAKINSIAHIENIKWILNSTKHTRDVEISPFLNIKIKKH